jgi:hypothetical protein
VFARNSDRDTVLPVLSESQREHIELIRKLDEANFNKDSHKLESTTRRGQSPVEVNNIWREKTSQDVNPLRTNRITFNPVDEEFII